MNSNTLDKILAGNVQAASRLIRGIEDETPAALAELKDLYPHTGKAHIIGLTGSPGVGKSTLIDALITTLRQRKMTVGVVAVDPTSPFSGGAILGDRVRMQQHCVDRDVFIRSMANRGWAGGLARATISAIHVMDAMGKDAVLVETVGAGQSEVDIARVADTVVVILSPVSGDEMQMIKAGIMEIADIFVINKADKEGAHSIASAVQFMLEMKPCPPGGWKPPILLTEAVFNKGIGPLVDEMVKHRQHLAASGELATRRKARARLELLEAVESSVKSYVFQEVDSELEKLVDDVSRRKIDPNTAAIAIINKFGQQLRPAP